MGITGPVTAELLQHATSPASLDLCSGRGVLADVVNTAARLAVHAGKHGLQVACGEGFKSEVVSIMAGGVVEFEEKGSVLLKGKATEVPVFTVKQVQCGRDTGSWDGPECGPQMIGREEELQSVLAFVDGNSGEVGDRMMVIETESGMGSSLLLLSVCRALSNRHTAAAEPATGGARSVCFLHTKASHEQPLESCCHILEWALQQDGEEAWLPGGRLEVRDAIAARLCFCLTRCAFQGTLLPHLW